MRLPIIMSAVVLLLSIAGDYYIYRVLRSRCKSRVPSVVQAITACMFILLFCVAFMLPRRSGDDSLLIAIMWMLFTFVSVYIPKAIFIIFDLIASIPRLFKRARWCSLTYVGASLGVMVFILMWWGALINRYAVDVKEVTIDIPDLPETFEGYRIVQISDLHVGTFGNDTTFCSKFVNDVNELHPDLIVFTGDIVNRHSIELIPHAPVLARLSAPDGVYSILGNHDYGDYANWPSPQAKQENMEQLYELQKDMRWRMLLNDHVWLRSGRDSIALIGVENVGDAPFHTYGSLPKAYSTPSDPNVKILLTHNPAHWTNDIADNDTMNIALALSGHTHAMQMELFGLSPAAFRYKNWGGLYHDNSGKRQLYVNIGAGTVGIPMRVGATPEITVITLHRKP